MGHFLADEDDLLLIIGIPSRLQTTFQIEADRVQVCQVLGRHDPCQGQGLLIKGPPVPGFIGLDQALLDLADPVCLSLQGPILPRDIGDTGQLARKMDKGGLSDLIVQEASQLVGHRLGHTRTCHAGKKLQPVNCLLCQAGAFKKRSDQAFTFLARICLHKGDQLVGICHQAVRSFRSLAVGPIGPFGPEAIIDQEDFFVIPRLQGLLVVFQVIGQTGLPDKEKGQEEAGDRH